MDAKQTLKQRQMALKAERERALAWLTDLAGKTPLGRYLTACLVCGKDSEGRTRCEKHQKEYNEVFFEDNQKFMEVFKGQN